MRLPTILLALSASSLGAQAPADTVAVLAHVADQVRAMGRWAGDSIWPGYRPDTIPLVFVLPSHGSLLLGWPDALPEGFVAVPGVPGAGWRDERALGSASTNVSLGGRSAAQMVVRSLRPVDLVPLAAHEAFHVFERASVAPGHRFGRGESAMIVSRYPVFDARNEADVALEGRLLAEALRAPTRDAARARAREFLAVREARQRRLGAEIAEFEAMAELNEGLAEYALVRALDWMAAGRTSSESDRAAARTMLQARPGRLDSLTTNVAQSIRLRYYSTGPALARLLDRLGGPDWKRRLMRDDLTLQEALAEATGYRASELALRRAAERRIGAARLAADAKASVARLQALRRRQVDSLLDRPGMRLVVDASAMAGGDIGNCGFDPQNLLRVTDAIEVHTRWLRPCNTSETFGEFNTPVVHDDSAGTIAAVIGPEERVRLTIAGVPRTLADGERVAGATALKIETDVATYQAGKADVERRGRELRVKLIP